MLEFKRLRGDQVKPQDIVHVIFRDDTTISDTSNEDDVIVEEFEEEETQAEQLAISSQIASLLLITSNQTKTEFELLIENRITSRILW